MVSTNVNDINGNVGFNGGNDDIHKWEVQELLLCSVFRNKEEQNGEGKKKYLN